MLTTLEHCIGQLAELNIKLIVLTGPPGSGKTRLLRQLGDKLGLPPLNLNLALGRRLSATAQADRTFHIGQLLREITDQASQKNDLLLLDNIEILFERSLKISPLDQIKRLAHAKPVVAVWPGAYRAKRLYYAEITHPEYRDYDTEGVVVLDM